MYQKILVPLDGSELAECVLPYTAAMAKGKLPVAINFLYVAQSLDVLMIDKNFKLKIESEAKDSANQYLNNLINRLDYKKSIKSTVLTGKAPETIIDFAASNDIDLIIMATHGMSGIGRWRHGDVADKVMHHVNTPVWLIKADSPAKIFMEMERKIKFMVPLDGSKLAEGTLKYTTDLVAQLGKELIEIILFRVCELFSPPYEYAPEVPANIEAYMEFSKNRTTEMCRHYLAEIEGKLKNEGYQINSIVVDGVPANTIIDYANKQLVDLIIMSTHGRTGISHLAFGSIAEKVTNGAKCPIFLVRSAD